MAQLLVFNALSSIQQAAQCPDFINKDTWSPNSPDLYPLDYHVWGLDAGKIQHLKPTTE